MRFTIPELATDPVILGPDTVSRGERRTLLIVVAHADDAAMFAGGVIAIWAAAGWRIVCLRVTDDRWDSVGLDEAETIERNSAEFRRAATVLGVAEVEDLMWPTDVLGDASRVKLRERLIHAIRRIRPYGLVTFDPDSAFYEDNLDHRVVAQAVDEAYWTAQFDKHHPEHFAEGLDVHGACERWYFGRRGLSVTHVFDTSSVLETQIEAILRHQTPLANVARQFELQRRTAGLGPGELVERSAKDRHEALVRAVFARSASAKGAPFGLAAAETLRLHRSAACGREPTL